MARLHSRDTAFAFRDEDFALDDYGDCPHGFCSLEVENLFPRAKFPMLREESLVTNHVYSLLEPALLLASRMIIQRWESFQIFIKRRPNNPTTEEWLDSDNELELSQNEVISRVKSVMPQIDFHPDLETNSNTFAQTTLHPEATSDSIVLDYNLIRILRDRGSKDSQRLAALFFISVLLCHELAHVLEFRCIREGRLRPDGESFETPPGITCREAGTGWETRAFGGRIYPVCKADMSLLLIRGICIRSSAWNYEMMKLNENWIRQLFSEEHWARNAHPLRPPVDVYARHEFIEDELIYQDPESPLKRKTHGSHVFAESYSPTKKGRVPRRIKICGGKKVVHGPPIS
ncbi:hypothetical protein AJ78_04578 [Emergomyces pasteurianus Ep9510]|uniref:Uncharacterized protein n=1 Tax=Emergomyces pasteurianus Ep9510 TaxID=1447872 RepID=A0A1J9PFB4_9EURO|nr:hypothetical protein AJ78_04578 [Emergomyces pasteurianus Ep9510]